MIAGLASELRAILNAPEASEESLKEATGLARKLVACQPKTASELEIQVESVIRYCGLDLSEDTSDALARDTLRNAVRLAHHHNAEGSLHAA